MSNSTQESFNRAQAHYDNLSPDPPDEEICGDCELPLDECECEWNEDEFDETDQVGDYYDQ